MSPAALLGVIVASLTAYLWWLYHILQTPEMSGDKWYMRKFALTDQPVTAPYRWRPLLPWLAGWLGFKPVTFAANAVTPMVIYYYAGGGWEGFCCAVIFLAIPHLFQFNIMCPEYAEGLGHCLFASTVLAMSVGHWSAFPLALLCAMTRETLTAAIGAIALFVNPWLLVPLAVGSAIAWFAREEDKDNQHPSIEGSYVATVGRWAKHKGWKALHFAHTILPLRGAPFAVPFVWGDVGAFARVCLVGCAAIWVLALPASGQSRIVCYAYILFVPFIAAIPWPWLAAYTILACFWPYDWHVFTETGGGKFRAAG